MCPGMQSTCPPPSSTDRVDVPSLGLAAAAVCAPELPHIAKGQSRGDDSLLIVTDRGTTGEPVSCALRARAEALRCRL